MSVIHVLRQFDEQDGSRYKNYTTLHTLGDPTPQELCEQLLALREMDVNGDIKVVMPEDVIWTHRPVPVAFDLKAAKVLFEGLAGKVLGDYDSEVDFSPASSYPDLRYSSLGVRAAWMVFVEREVSTMEQEIKSLLCEDEGCPHHGTTHVCNPPKE